MRGTRPNRTRWGLTNGAAVVVGLVLAALYVGLVITTGAFSPAAGPWGGRFDSNGERIYFTATSDSGRPIVAEMGQMAMATPMMACADCHGPNGRGGTVQMMMGSFEAPDIRYKTLTTEEMEHEEGEEHPPYTEELIKRAITQGLDPAGEPLNFPMPRWQMSESDLADLLDYLKSLQ